MAKRKLLFIRIDGDNTNYVASSDGMIYRINNVTGVFQVLTQTMSKDGYLEIRICDHTMYVHEIIAQRFIPNPERKPRVHHIDGDPLNNDVSNLMWVTCEEYDKLTKEQSQHHGSKGINNPVSLYTDAQIETARTLLKENQVPKDIICAITGITYTALNHLMHHPNTTYTTLNDLIHRPNTTSGNIPKAVSEYIVKR